MEYEIWAESYQLPSGVTFPAEYQGKIKASTFPEACRLFAKQNPDFAKDFEDNEDGLQNYGLTLFDNKERANKYYYVYLKLKKEGKPTHGEDFEHHDFPYV